MIGLNQQLLQQILIPLISVAGSFGVARVTAKHQMKRELFERRYDVYKSIFEYLLKLKRDKIYRTKEAALTDLLNLEVEAKLCGTRNLVSLMVALRKALEDSLQKMEETKEYQERQCQDELDYRREVLGEPDEDIDRWLNEVSLNDDGFWTDHALTDEFIKERTVEIVCELRRSLGYREFRPAVWFRKKRIYKKLRLWV